MRRFERGVALESRGSCICAKLDEKSKEDNSYHN